MKNKYIVFYIVTAVISVLIIILLATGIWKPLLHLEEEEVARTRIVMPRETGDNPVTERPGETTWWYEEVSSRIPLEERESIIAVLNIESEGVFREEQFVIYRDTTETESPLFITLISYDPNIRRFRRMWDMPIAASRSETISIFSQDLIGDRNNCIIVTGMNAQNEHTMTIFRQTPGQPYQYSYRKIAELQIAGSIVIQEALRSSAYQQGISRGVSFNIATYGPDPTSANILDQIETIYSFNPANQLYERLRVTRIPGTQIEQRRLRELLSGVPGVFENFIQGLWYFITAQGTIDTKQFLYFDPTRREIVFFGDDAQQVFRWQGSTPTRYGLYIRSQNLSIRTLMRFIDIELESLDSIRLRVIEDVRLKIAVSTTWDGSYRRAGPGTVPRNISQINSAINAIYESSWGRIQFYDTGEYTINSSGTIRNGVYVLFNIDRNNLVEFRPEENANGENRMTYRIEDAAGLRILTPVRLSTTGVQDTHEAPVTLTPITE
ncbi:MAG: pallilysin-related adhesin [Treponema sp.]|jgi:hypothetical protein|nr:pallilysin-related adhesin [Treponema sp.]